MTRARFLKVAAVRRRVHEMQRNGRRRQMSSEFLAALDRQIEAALERAARNANGKMRLRAADLDYKQGNLL